MTETLETEPIKRDDPRFDDIIASLNVGDEVEIGLDSMRDAAGGRAMFARGVLWGPHACALYLGDMVFVRTSSGTPSDFVGSIRVIKREPWEDAKVVEDSYGRLWRKRENGWGCNTVGVRCSTSAESLANEYGPIRVAVDADGRWVL